MGPELVRDSVHLYGSEINPVKMAQSQSNDASRHQLEVWTIKRPSSSGNFKLSHYKRKERHSQDPAQGPASFSVLFFTSLAFKARKNTSVPHGNLSPSSKKAIVIHRRHHHQQCNHHHRHYATTIMTITITSTNDAKNKKKTEITIDDFK